MTKEYLFDISSFKNSSIFGFIYDDFILQIEALNGFITDAKKNVIDKEKQLEDDRESLINNYDEDDPILMDGSFFSLEYDEIKLNNLSEFIKKSAFFYLFSKFEIGSYLTCKRLEFAYNLPDGYDKYVGNSRIKKYINFIHDNTGIDIKKINGWNKVDDLRNLRDFFIHTDGIVSGNIKRKYETAELTEINLTEGESSSAWIETANKKYSISDPKILYNFYEYILNLLNEDWELLISRLCTNFKIV